MEEKESKKQILVRVNNLNQVNVAIESNINNILIPFDVDSYELIRYCLVFGKRPFLDLTNIEKEERVVEAIEFLKKYLSVYKFGVFVDDINLYKILVKVVEPGLIIISPRLNVKNVQSFDLFCKDSCIIVSDELSFVEVTQLTQKNNQRLGIKIEGDYDLKKIGVSEVKPFLNWKKSLSDQARFFKNNKFSLYFVDLENISDYNLLLLLKNYKKLIDSVGEHDTEEVLNEIKVNGPIKKSYNFFNPKEKKDPNNKFKGIFLGVVANNKLKLRADLKKTDKILIKNKISTISKIKYIFVDNKKEEYAKQGQTIYLDLNEFKDGAKVYIRNTTQDYSFEDKKKVCFEIVVAENEPLVVKATCGDISVDYVGEIKSETAKNKPITSEYLVDVFSRLSNTPFMVEEEDIKITISENLIIPFSSINLAKKEIINRLIDKILGIKESESGAAFDSIEKSLAIGKKKGGSVKGDSRFFIKIYNDKDLEIAIKEGFDNFIFELYNKNLYKFVEVVKENNKHFYLETPLNVYPSQINDIIKLIQIFSPKGIIINDVGLITQKFDCERIVNYTIPTKFPSMITQKKNDLMFCHLLADKDELVDDINVLAGKKDLLYVYGSPIRYITRQKIEDKKVKLYNINLVQDPLTKDSVIYSKKRVDYLNDIKTFKNAGFCNFFIDAKMGVSEVVKQLSSYKKGK